MVLLCGGDAMSRSEPRNKDTRPPPDPDTAPDWTKKCENCEQTPIVPCTGMCGPCTFGEAETLAGNW